MTQETPKSPLPPYPNPPAAHRVRGLLCTDDKGRMQVVAPETALVDPEPIRSSTARNVRSLPPEESAAVCAIPGFYGLPSVVDSTIKAEPTLALATETPGQYVRASGTQISQMCLSHASFDTTFCRDLISTPSDPSRDEQNILHAVDNFTSRRIAARLDETLHIPPLPEAAQRIIALQQDPQYDLSDLVQIIETDPAIAARIMGWANSPFYGAGKSPRDLNDAIMRVLGFDLVFNMALGMAIGASLNLPESHVSGASPYWLRAAYTAATMEALAHQFEPPQRRPEPGLCYLAGLLSNFGTLVVGHVFPPQYDTICRIEEANPQLSHTYVDQYVLNVNREVIAATLLEQWGLPGAISSAVRNQYVTDCEKDTPYPQLLGFTHKLLQYTRADDSGADVPPPPEQLLEQGEGLGLSRAGVLQVVEVINGSQEALWEMAGVFE